MRNNCRRHQFWKSMFPFWIDSMDCTYRACWYLWLNWLVWKSKGAKRQGRKTEEWKKRTNEKPEVWTNLNCHKIPKFFRISFFPSRRVVSTLLPFFRFSPIYWGTCKEESRGGAPSRKEIRMEEGHLQGSRAEGGRLKGRREGGGAPSRK